ncbi:MAG: hypothetical protein ACOY4K_15840 [Pseudomonadota bacterium]
MAERDQIDLVQSQARVVTRAILNFVVDEIGRQTRRHDGDFVRAAVELAVSQATRGPAGWATDPARSVSVRAIAGSLGIAYETCRRKVRALEALGRCRRLGPGVAVSPGNFEGAAYEAASAEQWNRLRGSIAELRAIGFDYDLFTHISAQAPVRADDRLRTIAYLIDDYMLRLIESRMAGDEAITDSAVLTAMVTMNAEPMRHDPDLAWRFAGRDTPPPDSARAPVTIAMLARRLGMGDDSVGRRVAHLVRKGWACRVRGGYLSSMEEQQTPAVHQARLMSVLRFLQLVQALRLLGVDPATVAPDA